MAAAKPKSRREIEEKIVALAWKDDDFRKNFLADPKGQFEARLGSKLPADVKMTAFAEDANHLHFVIPAKPKTSVAELSDADLEKVAGGLDVVIGSVAVLVATAVASGGGTALSAVLTKREANW